jgi:hypothetical protein
LSSVSTSVQGTGGPAGVTLGTAPEATGVGAGRRGVTRADATAADGAATAGVGETVGSPLGAATHGVDGGGAGIEVWSGVATGVGMDEPAAVGATGAD